MINKVLILDNFDSFTFNIVDYFKQLNCKVVVYRNTISPDTINEDFDLLVLSPGPSVPKNAGYMMDWIKKYYQTKPIFGICLGHQALIEFFGGELQFLPPVHGKSHEIKTDGRSIYHNLPKKIDVGRYHSLAGKIIPDCFEVSGKTDDNIVMSIRHKTLPIEGVQYHPESILSMNHGAGMQIIKNVVEGRLHNGNAVLNKTLNQLQKNEKISKNEFKKVLEKVNENELTSEQILMLLISLSFGLKSSDSLYEFINAIREFQTPIHQKINADFVDICGTGGSGLPRINTSTLSAFALSSAGTTILKHGNKASSGRFGSFDLIEKLGINYTDTNFEKSVEKTNLALLFAPSFHPIFRHFAQARKTYGIPTVFNILGPFLNPFQPKKQLIGTSFKEFMPLMIELGKKLNYEHLIIVRGEDNLDEVTLSDKTFVMELKNGAVSEYYISAEDFGLETIPFSELSSKNTEENCIIAQEIIDGKTNSEHYKLVLANSAFVYSKFFKPEQNLKDSYNYFVELMKSGKIKNVVDEYKKCVL
ncbi:MAG: anthranilate phosphoribosyltransferase [Flavobacteriales bacterium]|nr:anthranilate phosphoribosyltransferase [Flavobacteriales bacterium]